MRKNIPPSLDARAAVLGEIIAAIDHCRPMPKAAAIAVDIGRSLSVVHDSLGALHDDGTLTLVRGRYRFVAKFVDGTETVDLPPCSSLIPVVHRIIPESICSSIAA